MTARTTEDFDRWWNEHYFQTTNPRYKIYKRLFTKRLTLDSLNYIDFLCNALAFGDRIPKMTRKAQPKKEQPGLLDKIAKVNEQEFSQLMLIRLFQQDTTCSVLACHGRRFLEAWVNFSVSLPAKRLVRNIWQLVAGLTGLSVRSAGTSVRMS